MTDLEPHSLSVALIRPQIAENVGNVGRTCVATGTRLHLVRPLGFVLDDKRIKRAGLDYWTRLALTVHDSEAAFFDAAPRAWLFDSTGRTSLFDADFEDGDVLVFGSETRGLPPELLAGSDRTIRIPQVPGERCLNLATSVGVALYAALHRAGAATP